MGILYDSTRFGDRKQTVLYYYREELDKQNKTKRVAKWVNEQDADSARIDIRYRSKKQRRGRQLLLTVLYLSICVTFLCLHMDKQNVAPWSEPAPAVVSEIAEISVSDP